MPELPFGFLFLQVTPGGKAQRMGVQDGDYLLSINSNDCVNASHNDALRLVKTAGGSVVLSILRYPLMSAAI